MGGPTEVGEAERLARVWSLLEGAAGAGRFLRFDRFLEVALYSPEVGYYARPEVVLGKGGDFYTAAHASPLFGGTIARRVLAEFERLGRPADFTLVEVGPGDGTLAADLLSALARSGELGGAPLRHVLVEPSAALARRAAERVSDSPHPDGWGLRLESSVSGIGPFRGIVVANEFLDALPFRRLIWHADGVHELGVRLGDRTAGWAEAPYTDPVPPPPLPEGPGEGVVLEVSPRAEAFLREVGDHLVQGSFLAVDYGEEESALLGHYPRGSLTAFRRNQVVPDPLERPGSADLSAFVDVSRIRAAAARAGLREVAFEGQATALGRWGVPGVLDAALAAAPTAEERGRLQRGATNLLFGFERFRVLELTAG